MNTIEARSLTTDDYEAWDQCVEQCGCGTIFHSTPWITRTARSLNLEFAMIGAFEGERLAGGCCFYKKRRGGLITIGTTRALLSPYGGFVLPDIERTKVRSTEGRRRRIVSALLDEIEKERMLSVTISNAPNLIDLRDFLSRDWMEAVHYTYMVRLDGDLLANLDGSVRKVIRKAEKHGVVVAKEYDPSAFWGLLSLTFEKQGLTVPYSRDHLFGLVEELHERNLCETWMARTPTGEPVSCSLVVNNTTYAHGLIAASDPSLLSTGANTLLQFHIFQDLQEKGYEKFEIWGATAPRLAAYYSSLNPELVPYYSMKRVRLPGPAIKLMRSIAR